MPLGEFESQLKLLHEHVKEALVLLGVDVSLNGYIPDSWALREQCLKAKQTIDKLKVRLAAAETCLYYRGWGECGPSELGHLIIAWLETKK